MGDETVQVHAAIIFIISMVILFLITGLCVSHDSKRGLKQEAIKYGYAQYHPTTGEWMWKTNVLEKVEK